jgi:hypothetical protein
MIHQLPLAILEKHLIPILIEDTLPNLRGSCELLCDLSSRRFARFQSKMMTQKTNAHAELTDQLLNDWQQQARDNIRKKEEIHRLYRANRERREQLEAANVLIHKLDSAIQKHAPHILLEPKNTTKPKYLGSRNGPVENFKQWLIHENGEPAGELCARSCPRLEELKETHSFYSQIYHPRLPWFRYIELHMDISESSKFREGLSLPKTL